MSKIAAMRPGGEDRGTSPVGGQHSAVLVVGMHRSGTSAVTRMLNLLGCTAPATPLPDTAGNPTGHWESQPIVDLNDRVMAAFDLSWFDWAGLPPDWPAGALWQTFAAEARGLLDQEFGAAPLFVLKDPRLCQLLPGWRALLADGGTATRVVMPLRHPTEVARSLAARDGMDRSAAYLLWLRYTLEAERASRGLPRIILPYDHLLADWRDVAVRVSEALAIAWPRAIDEVAAEIDGFLSPAARHHLANDQAPTADAAAFGWVDRVYGALQPAGATAGHPPDTATLDAVRAELDAATPVFARPVQIGHHALMQVHELRQRLDRLDSAVTDLRADRDVLSDRIDTVYASTSWQVTRPLRAGARVARRIRRGAVGILTGRDR